MSFQQLISALAKHYLRFSTWLVLAGGILLVILSVYTGIDVGGRYLVNQPLPATFELTITAVVIIVFLSLTHTQAIKGHLKLDFFLHKMSPRANTIIEIFTLVIGMFLVGLIAWQAWSWAWEAWLTKEEMQGIWGIPYFPSRLGLTIGAFLLFCQYLIDLLQISSRLSRKRKTAQEG